MWRKGVRPVISMSMGECSPRGTVAVRVRTVGESVDRLYGDNEHCATLKLGLKLRVVDDYIHVGTGDLYPLNLQALAEMIKEEARRKSRSLSFQEMLDITRSASRLLGGLVIVKRMYKCRDRPCIPGSTFKGVVRSRIELGSLGSNAGAGGQVLTKMLYGSQPPKSLPLQGSHGWRHARIWCESVFEDRKVPGQGITVLEDLVGRADKESLGSRVFFPDLRLASEDKTVILQLDHGETVEAVPRGAVFEGEIIFQNVSLEDVGVILYGLGLDKRYLCNNMSPRVLIGAFKYRARRVERLFEPSKKSWVESGRIVCFGAVEAELTSIVYASWSRCRWFSDVHELARQALEAATKAYPELRMCFDEVARRDSIAGCRQRGGVHGL